MMAGVVLPSAAAFIRRDRLEQLVFDVSMLCRETFEQSVYEGKPYRIELNNLGELVPMAESNGTYTPAVGVMLRPAAVPETCTLDWPEKGWQTMPEGFCETPLLHFADKESNESRILRIRAYDANLVEESGQYGRVGRQ